MITPNQVENEIRRHKQGVTFNELATILRVNPVAHLAEALDFLYEQKKIGTEVFRADLPCMRIHYMEEKIFPR